MTILFILISDEEINQDTKIYLITILISSLFIDNSFVPIDEPAMKL